MQGGLASLDHIANVPSFFSTAIIGLPMNARIRPSRLEAA
jgi:hypothetical protein